MEPTPSDTSVLNDPNMKDTRLKKNRFSKVLTEGVAHHNSRLSYEQQLKIVYYIATYIPHKEIMEKMQEQYGKKVTSNQIQHFVNYPSWQPKIEKFREEFESKIVEEPLASKRVRIKELGKAYARFETSDETLHKAVDVLSKIREEVEGKGSQSLSLTQYNQYNGLSDEDLRKIIVESNRFIEVAEKRKQEINIEATDGEGTEGGNE